MFTTQQLIAGLTGFALCLSLAQANEKFEALFKPDLSEASFPAGVWSMDKDGVLNATRDEIIWTKADYQDFILRLEFKNEAGTNSGVFVHGSDLKNWTTDSVEIQICDDYAEKWAAKPGNWQCGAIFGHQAAYIHAVKPPGEWNQMTIICSGPIITVHLNGQRVNTVDLRSFTDAKTNPDGSTPASWQQNKPLATLPLVGKIGFQGKHGEAAIHLRGIEILKL